VAEIEKGIELLPDAGRRWGMRHSAIDSLVAATALRHDLTVVTRNVAGIGPSGARVHSPWRG